MAFPPAAPTVTQTIPSYLYVQYNDDDDLQALVASYNFTMQQIINWFTTIGLPVYTGSPISGPLLDWVALGLYGMARPVLASGSARHVGPFNTVTLNALPFDQIETINPSSYIITTDDVFKRCLTWNHYKGDGFVFCPRWLKRRVMRWLTGYNGTDVANDQTYDIGVTYSAYAVTITINNSASYPLAQTFADAVASNVLNLPLQYTFTVTLA